MKTRTMYMHTMDYRPASYDGTRGPYIHFVSGRRPVKLVPSLAQLRKEQRATMVADSKRHPLDTGFVYGYVRVAVPA